jgi:hypothetical protein
MLLWGKRIFKMTVEISDKENNRRIFTSVFQYFILQTDDILHKFLTFE